MLEFVSHNISIGDTLPIFTVPRRIQNFVPLKKGSGLAMAIIRVCVNVCEAPGAECDGGGGGEQQPRSERDKSDILPILCAAQGGCGLVNIM